MKEFGNASKRSTFYTVLVVSIVVSFAVSMLGNLLNFRFLRNVMDSETVETERVTTSIAFGNIDSQLEAATKANATIMIGSHDLRDAIASENANAIRAQLKALSKIIDVVPIIASFDILFPSSDTVLVNSSHLSYDVTEQELSLFLPWLEMYTETKQRAAILPDGPFNYPEYNSYITYIASSPVNSAVNQVITAIHMNPGVFAQYINEVDGEFLIFDKQHKLIYKSSGSCYSDFAMAKLETQVTTFEVQSFAETEGSARLYYSIMSSSVLPLDFVYIKPSLSINLFLPYLQSFLINAVILVLVNLLLIYLLILRNDSVYRNRIKSIVPDESGKRTSFDQISDVLEKKFNNINSSYSNAQPILIQNELRMVMLGRGKGSAGLCNLDDLLPYERIRIAIVRLRSGCARENISTILASELENLSHDIICYLTTIRNETIIVINSCNEDFGLSDLQFENRNLKLYLSAVNRNGEEGLQMAYNQACEVLPYEFMYPEIDCLDYDGLNLAERKTKLPGNGLLSRFEESLMMQSNSSLSEELFSSIINSLMTQNVAIEYCRAVTRDIVSVFNKCIVNQNIDPVGLIGYDVRTYYETLIDIRGYEAWMKVCLSNYFNYLEELRQTHIENRIKEQIDSILRDAPSNLLSLEYVATKMNMRSDELSRLFKSCYGINYSEYIRDLKMEHAKELLANGLMVKEISCQLGYNAPQYFIKVFKQATGITPSQYSRIMKTKDRIENE